MGSVLRILGGLLAAYMLLEIGAFAFQDRLVYFPDNSPATVPDGFASGSRDADDRRQ